MTDKNKTVTVVGAGNMGGPIAAQYANAGYTVYLLDRVPKSEKDPAYKRLVETGDRSVIARDKLEKMRKAVNPAEDIFNATLYHPSNADRIIVGNVDDNLEEAVKNSSLIAEAILDQLDLKIALASKCDEYMDEGTQFHSNTSTIELEKIKEDFQCTMNCIENDYLIKVKDIEDQKVLLKNSLILLKEENNELKKKIPIFLEKL